MNTVTITGDNGEWKHLTDGYPSEVGWYDVLYSWEPAEDWEILGRSRRYWDGYVWRKYEGGIASGYGNDDVEGERYRRSAS